MLHCIVVFMGHCMYLWSHMTNKSIYMVHSDIIQHSIHKKNGNSEISFSINDYMTVRILSWYEIDKALFMRQKELNPLSEQCWMCKIDYMPFKNIYKTVVQIHVATKNGLCKHVARHLIVQIPSIHSLPAWPETRKTNLCDFKCP